MVKTDTDFDESSVPVSASSLTLATPQRKFLEIIKQGHDAQQYKCYTDMIQFEDEKLESVIRDVLMCGKDDERAKMFTQEGLLMQCSIPKLA